MVHWCHSHFIRTKLIQTFSIVPVNRLLGKAIMQVLDDVRGLVHPLAIALFIRDFQAGYLGLAAALQ